MILKLKEKELSFRWLQECDIDNIEEQIKNYEKENGKLTLESFYKLYIYSDIDQLGGDEYDIDIHIQDDEEAESSLLISWNLGDTTYEIAQECEEELNKYLTFRFIELAVNNL